jgi:hypothetical protein
VAVGVARDFVINESELAEARAADQFGFASSSWFACWRACRTRPDGRTSGASGGARRSQWDEAVAAFQRSLQIHVQLESTAGAPEAFEGLASVWWEHDQGKRERALEAHALAQALRERTGAARAPFNDRWVASLLETVHSPSGSQQWKAHAAAVADLSMADYQARMAEFAQ